MRWVVLLGILVASCVAEEDPLDTSVVGDCRCFEADAGRIELVCDPGEDCGTLELTCLSWDSPCRLEDSEVLNPEVLDCAQDLLTQRRAGAFGYHQQVQLGNRSGRFYTDGVRAFVSKAEAIDIGYDMRPVETGPLREASEIAACGAFEGVDRLNCLFGAMAQVEQTCTPGCGYGVCEDGP